MARDGTEETTPAQPVEESPTDSSAGAFDDIMAMMSPSGDEEDSPPVEEAVEAPEAVQAEDAERKAPGKEVAEPQPPPEPAAEAVPDPGATVQPPVESTPTPAVEVKPAQPAVETPDVEGERAKRIEAIRAKREDTRTLLEKQYMDRIEFSEEEAAQLLVEPEKVLRGKLSRLSSELFMDMYEALQRTNWASVPHLVRGEVAQQQATQKAERAFFEKWPALSKPEYADTIRQVSAVHRQQHPQATLEQAIAQVGAMVSVSLGIPAPGTKPEQRSAPEKPPSKPFTPAGPGGTGLSLTPETPPSEWETFGKEIERLG